MRFSALGGELVLCLIFVGAGIFWIAVAAGMPLWDGFAPASGFLPMIYGVLLVGLAIAATAFDVMAHGRAFSTDGKTGSEPSHPPAHRSIVVLLALAAGVAGMSVAGFPVSMFLMMLFLFRVAERLALIASLGVAAVTSGVLTLVFRGWLGVPLPAGPWGF